jgi:ParB family transcriptional regulator, chromosome partitioning protein
MATKRPSLGRGLEALLGTPRATPEQETDGAAPPPRNEELARIPVDLLQRGRFQPRLDMRPESLQELADSIRAQGVVQPIVVRPLTERRPGEPLRYEIIAGERRWRAAQMAGLHDIPAVIRRVPDEAAVAMSLIENIQRENLNPIEEAQAYRRLHHEFHLTQEQIAAAVGKDRASIANYLRLLKLPEEVRRAVAAGDLSMGHARALLGLDDQAAVGRAAREVASRGLSVRATEALVARMARGRGAARSARPADVHTRAAEERISVALGTRARIVRAGKGGRIEIEFVNEDELQRLYEKLTGR